MSPLLARPLLLPLNPAYRLGLALRELRLSTGLEKVRRLHHPVVSIGSLSAGGAGKTPLTIALAGLLTRNGYSVDVLSRGYGRQGNQPARVRPDGTAEEFGDEPLLIARDAGVPVYVAARRYEAGLLAEVDAQKRSEPGRPLIHLLDDGFQHRQLHRDVNILLIGANDLRDRLLPAGNLREPLNNFRRATVIAVSADEPEVARYLREIIDIDRGTDGPRRFETIWKIRRTMEVPPSDGPVAAFCGIARSDQFFEGLQSAGLRLAVRTAFPDHHRYTAREIDRLLAAAHAAGATSLVTTEKDEARLGRFLPEIAKSIPLLTARLCIAIEQENEVLAWLKGRLA